MQELLLLLWGGGGAFTGVVSGNASIMAGIRPSKKNY